MLRQESESDDSELMLLELDVARSALYSCENGNLRKAGRLESAPGEVPRTEQLSSCPLIRFQTRCPFLGSWKEVLFCISFKKEMCLDACSA